MVFSFSKTNGFLVSVKSGDIQFLNSPLTINFWRAPTENDFGNKMPERCRVWRKAGENAEFRGISHSQDARGYYAVTPEYWLPDVESITSSLTGSTEPGRSRLRQPDSRGPNLSRTAAIRNDLLCARRL